MEKENLKEAFEKLKSSEKKKFLEILEYRNLIKKLQMIEVSPIHISNIIKNIEKGYPRVKKLLE